MLIVYIWCVALIAAVQIPFINKISRSFGGEIATDEMWVFVLAAIGVVVITNPGEDVLRVVAFGIFIGAFEYFTAKNLATIFAQARLLKMLKAHEQAAAPVRNPR